MSRFSPLKVGIVGCGNVALVRHAPAILELDMTTVVAIADPTLERREEARQLLKLSGGSVFDSHEAMISASGPVAVCDDLTVVTREGETTLPLANPRRIFDTFVKVHQDFVRAVSEDREPAAPAEEGLRALEAAMAAYASAVMGQVVELPL